LEKEGVNNSEYAQKCATLYGVCTSLDNKRKYAKREETVR